MLPTQAAACTGDDRNLAVVSEFSHAEFSHDGEAI
jgi:hypothetical protein